MMPLSNLLLIFLLYFTENENRIGRKANAKTKKNQVFEEKAKNDSVFNPGLSYHKPRSPTYFTPHFQMLGH